MGEQQRWTAKRKAEIILHPVMRQAFISLIGKYMKLKIEKAIAVIHLNMEHAVIDR
jgi:hypothetical protein